MWPAWGIVPNSLIPWWNYFHSKWTTRKRRNDMGKDFYQSVSDNLVYKESLLLKELVKGIPLSSQMINNSSQHLSLYVRSSLTTVVNYDGFYCLLPPPVQCSTLAKNATTSWLWLCCCLIWFCHQDCGYLSQITQVKNLKFHWKSHCCLRQQT